MTALSFQGETEMKDVEEQAQQHCHSPPCCFLRFPDLWHIGDVRRQRWTSPMCHKTGNSRKTCHTSDKKQDGKGVFPKLFLKLP